MDLAPTRRFSSRAEAYASGRPGYPNDVLLLLERECGLTRISRIADIGSGTGLLSQLFLSFGCEVFAVEPNTEMRAAGERALRGNPRFHSVDGRAEATGLPDSAFNLISAGQAFHWFEPEAARNEFRRILKPEGWIVLAWNERCPTPGFMTEYERMQERFARERPHPSADEFTAFFGHAGWRLAKIPNPHAIDEETLRARLESSSWSPKQGSEEYAPMIQELRRIFQKYEFDGHVAMDYETHVYYGK
jgi:SAM-dependent methyltransferase